MFRFCVLAVPLWFGGPVGIMNLEKVGKGVMFLFVPTEGLFNYFCAAEWCESQWGGCENRKRDKKL